MMIRKRDGRVVEFDETKITDAIFEAAKSVGGADRQLAMELTLNVLKALKNENKQNTKLDQFSLNPIKLIQESENITYLGTDSVELVKKQEINNLVVADL